MIGSRFQMTPYRINRALDVLAGLVVTSVAVALAGLTWRLAGYADIGAVAVPAVRRAAPVPDLAPAIALAPFGRAATTDAAVATGLQVQLRGIIFARPEALSSAIIQVGSEVARPFKVGEAVSGATIQAIEPRRVLLMNGGRVEFLAFPDPFAAPPVPGTITPGAPTNPPAAPPPVAAAPAPALPTNPAALLQRFDAQPVSGGYRVGANAPPGLQQGDVLQQVNGQALSTPDAAAAALARAQASGTAQIQITRDGKPVTLTIPVR